MTRYLLNPDADLEVLRGHALPADVVARAIEHTHSTIEQFGAFEVDVFELLGMRNLSAFVGEIFAASIRICADGLFVKNPHQDGYPDLLLMDPRGRRIYDRLQGRLREKAPFSPFAGGGVEVKATCGSTPSAKALTKKGLAKPAIGERRIDLLTNYDWKAHHRETNHLLSILWDFAEGRPFIAAVFYSNRLTEDDWGRIVSPRAGGGRTTSISIMNTGGRRKMYEGWVACVRDRRYIDFLNKKNKGALIPTR